MEVRWFCSSFKSQTLYSSFPAYLSTLQWEELRDLISFPLFPVNMLLFTSRLFQENMVTNFDPALLCVSALITISFPLLSVVLFTDWVMAFFFLGNDPSKQFSSYLSTEHKLVGALSCHRMGCGTIVANRSLNLLFKCFPFDITICLHQHRCDFSVSEP